MTTPKPDKCFTQNPQDSDIQPATVNIVSDVPLGLPKEKTPQRIAWEKSVKAYAEALLKYRDGEITFEDVADILDLTIKEDRENKKIIFASMLLNYTDNCQQNILMKADSSTGKTYLIKEIVALFPPEDIVELFNCSPTAFIYEYGNDYDPETHTIEIDLHQKILVFYDQKNLALLKELRPLLSHDKKKLITKRTDRSNRYGHSTKTIRLRGYPTFIVCNASHKILDEQELTRAFIISPETSQEKLKASLRILTERLSNNLAFRSKINQTHERLALIERIAKIKKLKIADVIIPDDLKINLYNGFLEDHGFLTPRNMRDYPRLIALIKAHALLNAEHREIRLAGYDKLVVANETDIGEGIKTYSYIAASNELGLSPEIYDIWKKVVQPNLTPYLTRTILRQKFFTTYHRNLSNYKTKEVLETLQAVGLIIEDVNPENKRERIYTEALTNEQTTLN